MSNATIKDIAKAANVSVATVSRVVNNGPKVGPETRARIVDLIETMGYRPNFNARSLVTNKSSTIGVVIPDVADPFFAALANSVDKVARLHNTQLLISTGQLSADSELEAIKLLLQQRCESIIIHSKLLPNETLIKLFNDNPNFVLINRYIEEIAHRCIWLDNIEGGKIAAKSLIKSKHLNIACILSNYDIEDPSLRLKGFTEQLKESNQDIDQKLVVYAEPTLQGGEAATQKLLAANTPFSAVFVYNDAMAIGAISTLEDNGLSVPKDVSVIGCDDVLLSRFSRPKLTTLQYPIETMAHHAAKLSLNIAVNVDDCQPQDASHPSPDIQPSLKYTPVLIERESTAIKTD